MGLRYELRVRVTVRYDKLAQATDLTGHDDLTTTPDEAQARSDDGPGLDPGYGRRSGVGGHVRLRSVTVGVSRRPDPVTT